MTFDERSNAIGSFLRAEILPRYVRPSHLDDTTARAEVADMVADVNREWPVMPADRFAAVGAEWVRHIRRAHTSRSWPTIALLLKALDAALTPAAPALGGTGGEPPHVYEIVREWWTKHGDKGPGSLPHERHAERLVAEGLATWGVLFRKGFPIPDDRRAAAKAEKDPGHERVLDDILRMGERLKGSGFVNPAFRGAAE